MHLKTAQIRYKVAADFFALEACLSLQTAVLLITLLQLKDACDDEGQNNNNNNNNNNMLNEKDNKKAGSIEGENYFFIFILNVCFFAIYINKFLN